jgi:hypothetical protein
MAIAQQPLSYGDKRLDVAAGASNEDGDLERWWRCADADRRSRVFEVEVPCLAQDTLHLVGRSRPEVDLDAIILAEGDGPYGPLGELARPELQQAVSEECSRRFFTTYGHVCLMYSRSPGFLGSMARRSPGFLGSMARRRSFPVARARLPGLMGA